MKEIDLLGRNTTWSLIGKREVQRSSKEGS
jgi:hypothetical protein